MEATDVARDVTADDKFDDILTALLFSNKEDAEAVHGGSRPEQVGSYGCNYERHVI